MGSARRPNLGALLYVECSSELTAEGVLEVVERSVGTTLAHWEEKDRTEKNKAKMRKKCAVM